MTLDDLECQNKGFYVFFYDFWLRHTFQERIVPKSLEDSLEDQDNLQMKFSALNSVFTSLNFALLSSRNSSYECVKLGYPFQNTRISHPNGSSHSRWWCHLAYVNASYHCQLLRFCLQWAFKHAPLLCIPLCLGERTTAVHVALAGLSCKLSWQPMQGMQFRQLIQASAQQMQSAEKYATDASEARTEAVSVLVLHLLCLLVYCTASAAHVACVALDGI